jgi:hypothetical protein
MHGQQNMKLMAQNKVTTDNLWLKVRFLLSTRKMATINITSKDISIYLKYISRGTSDMRVLGNQEEMASVKSPLHSCII